MSGDDVRLAVLIDADNTTSKLLPEMLEELAGYGTVTVKRAYGDWGNPHLQRWRQVMLDHAIAPRQQFAYTVGKNATDSALIIDAMDLLYSGAVDGFALVSSDSDFTPLATRLRESGKRVIGVGRRTTPNAFVQACERFLFLEVLAESGEGRPEAASEPPRASVDETVPEPPAETEKAQPPRSLHSALTKALNRLDTDAEDWASLGALGNHLSRTDASFDARTYGFAKLSDLVKAQHFLETKTVGGANGGGSLWVRLKGRRSEPAATEPATKKAAAKRTGTKKTSAKKAPSEPPAKTAKKAAKKTAKKA